MSEFVAELMKHDSMKKFAAPVAKNKTMYQPSMKANTLNWRQETFENQLDPFKIYLDSLNSSNYQNKPINFVIRVPVEF